MTTREPYNQRTLNLQAAEFYKSIGKDKSKWKSVVDLSPMLAEFRHYIAADDYEKAFYVYNSLFGHLSNWYEHTRIIEMGKTLLSEKNSFRKLSEVIVMKIKANMSWSYLMTTQLDKGEKTALEAKIIADKLLAEGSSDDDDYISACETITMISNCLVGYCLFSGRIEKIHEITKENQEKLKNVDNPLYHASRQVFYGWALQQINDTKAPEMLGSSLKLFEELDEAEMDLYHLNERERNLYILSGAYADKGQIKASFELLEKGRELYKKTNNYHFELAFPTYVGSAFRYSYIFSEARSMGEKAVMNAEKHEHRYHAEKSTAFTGNLIRDKGVWNIFINKSESEEGEEKPYKYQKKAFTFFQAAIEIYQQAAEIAEKLGLKADVAKLHGKIGNIYCRLGDGDPGLFVLAEENLKKALDLTQSDTTKYGTCLNLGRLYVYEAAKIYKDSRGRRKEEAVSKVNQANECFTKVYEDAGKKDDNGSVVKDANGNVVWDEPVYGAKAAYRLGVAALETALVNESEGDDKKKKFDEASEKFHEAAHLFKKCAAEVKKNKFLSGQEAEDFREKYGEEPINLRLLAEMKYGRAVALLGALVFVDEYVSEKDVKEHRKREVKQAYEDAFSQVPDSIDFLREAFRELNMLRVSLGKEKNRAQKAMDDSRKAIICTWLEKNEGIEEKYDETAGLNWGFPISKNVIEEFLADNNCDKILGKTG